MSAANPNDEISPIEQVLFVIVLGLAVVLAILLWTQSEPETVDDMAAPFAVSPACVLQ